MGDTSKKMDTESFSFKFKFPEKVFFLSPKKKSFDAFLDGGDFEAVAAKEEELRPFCSKATSSSSSSSSSSSLSSSSSSSSPSSSSSLPLSKVSEV